MNQLTVRGFDEELSEAIRELAVRDGLSLNQAVLRLLRKGAGLSDRSRNAECVGSSLDHLIGSWSESDVVEMDAALEEFEVVDASIWR